MNKTLKKHIKKYCDKHGFPIDAKETHIIFNIRNLHPILSKLYPNGYGLTNPNDDEFWYKNGKFHREEDKPAVIYYRGEKQWYKNGRLHRDGDEPAVIYYNGSKQWYKNDELHRDGDKPAVIRPDGKKAWYKNGNFIKSNT